LGPTPVGETSAGSRPADDVAAARGEPVSEEGASGESAAPVAPETEAAPQAGGAAKLAATTIATTVFESANTSGPRVGYIRLGGVVERAPASVSGRGCKGEWYPIEPTGFVCTDE